ncbi:hypothetical protein ACQEVF_58130 [Nonomuraea polychroma]
MAADRAMLLQAVAAAQRRQERERSLQRERASDGTYEVSRAFEGLSLESE